ncbi:Rho GTPase activating protein 8, partial [Homo sapiens]
MAGQDPALSTSHPFYDVARHGILQVAGDDRFGRRVVTFSCCRMPPSHELDHQRLLEYLKYTLDQYVENDYTIVYFHYGLNSRNKPSLGWLQSAYKEFDRKDGDLTMWPRLVSNSKLKRSSHLSLPKYWDY